MRATDAGAADGADRSQGRRKADKKATDFFGWLESQLKHSAALGALYLLLASLIGWVGGRIVSPKEEADALRKEMLAGFNRQDSLRTALAASMQARDSAQTLLIAEMRDQIRDGAANARFTGYALCIMFRRTDPALAPPECGAVIQRFQRPP